MSPRKALSSSFLVPLVLASAACGMSERSPYSPVAMPAPPLMVVGVVGSPPPPPPAEAPSAGEQYAVVADNPFHLAAGSPLSTFSADVDTASYSNVRRFLMGEGHMPPPEAVRLEEMLNYFTYDYPTPTGDAPISATIEVSACPWASNHELARIGLQAKRIDAEHMPPRNLVFLLDVSGSMEPANRLPMVKKAMRMLVDQLTARDTVSIVTYAGASGVALEPTRGDDTGTIVSALSRLEPGGSTNGGAGIELAYKLARQHFSQGGINRVILSTDGDFNVGTTSQGALVRLIEKERQTGVYLSVLGVGEGNLHDATMEMLADKGNGNYAYLDTLAEARKVLVTQAGGTLVTVANDVKIQADFDPTQVKSYRLVGYENRVLENKDFSDDTKDAGDMGAGHSVTALYEIEPLVASPAPERPLTVRIRYKDPGSAGSKLLTFASPPAHSLSQASEDFRFAASVAAFGLVLRGSPFKGDASPALALSLASSAMTHDPNGYRAEFLRMVSAAERIHDGSPRVARVSQ
jgi:Ca-activated chloride channel homolog